ncbi:sel1 repeat family protein [Aggregatibacter actinomycetemcomitans]|uniref:tetratricopeptide repeat protein n=1 Tax=Aggregatibacter actinomycetemcomitans TaxID=714 RepID=UPI00197B729A|nr:tetratricopeptide repeat protein [Aggregatibacter actinomycetemcomitans]MBN6075139.1 sel1 repeat family protein [Aggregatibacter actinomycetemcomitans]
MKMMKKQLKHFVIVLGLLGFSVQAAENVAFSVAERVQEMSTFVQNKLNNDELRNLARYFYQSDDVRSAFNVMRILALRGDSNAQLDLGRLYFGGDGVEKNYEKAYWWFSEAAEKGSVKALTNLGILYTGGYGVKKNLEYGINLLEQAAEVSDSQAILILGMLYYNENKIKNFNKAFQWLERSARQGNEEAIFRLALMYEHGEGTQRNRPLAISIYKDLIAQQSYFSDAARERLEILSYH